MEKTVSIDLSISSKNNHKITKKDFYLQLMNKIVEFYNSYDEKNGSLEYHLET